MARDFVSRNDPCWVETSQKWLEAKKRLEAIENEEKSLRESLIQMTENQSSIGGGIRLTRSMRKGSVQYSQIPELQGINLEKHRKEPSEIWRLSAFCGAEAMSTTV
jgi:hypothetical protein